MPQPQQALSTGGGSSSSPPRNNNVSLTSSISNGASPPPATATARRPPPAIRLPSCQIQRNWDREQSPPQTGASSSNSRRSRAATIASPIGGRSPGSSSFLSQPPLPTATATGGGGGAGGSLGRSAYASAMMPYPPQPTLLEGQVYSNNNNNNNNTLGPTPTSHPLSSPNNTSSTDYKNSGGSSSNEDGTQPRLTQSNNPLGERNIVILDENGVPIRQDQMEGTRDEDPSNNTDGQQQQPRQYGWAGALMSKGRRRAATTAAALGMGNNNNNNNNSGGGGGPLSPTSEQNEHHIRPGGSNSNALDDFQDPTLAGADIDSNATQNGRNEAYDHQVHDLLDVLDPEVQTVNLLGDFQNTFFIPPNRLFDRTRKLQLTKPPETSKQDQIKHADAQLAASDAAAAGRASRRASIVQGQAQPRLGDRLPAGAAIAEGDEGKQSPLSQLQPQGGETSEKVQEKFPSTTSAAATGTATGTGARPEEKEEKELPGPPVPPHDGLEGEDEGGDGGSTPTQVDTLLIGQTKMTKGNYFVLPTKLVDMSDWTEQEKADLDDYVRHLLHSKKEKFKRRMRGFGKYVRTPLGCFVTVYASLLTFWGTAWMLFIIGWLPAGDRQAYFVEICDQILVALFCLTGLGLIPWRIRDTYHAYYIIKYHRKTLKLRQQRGLPKLSDNNDLPNDQVLNLDLEMAGHAQDAVLNDDEQALLVKHQTALAKSHTYYRPHETITHHAFPLSFLIAIIVLCDCHSIFQLSLGSATWSISYHHWYKKILTTIILCFSLSCNITGGICIAVGSRLSRKTEVVEALMRQAVTQEALKRKEDAERYRAEKRARKLQQAERESHHRTNSGGLLKTGSFPANITKNASSAAALKLKLMSTKNNSDPGLREKLVKRRSSSGRSSSESQRGGEVQRPSSLRRSGSERVTDPRFDTLEPHHE